MDQIFAHSLGRADFIGGAIRLELITFQPDTALNPSGAKAEVTHVVFMPLEGFLKSVATQEGLVRQLAQVGVIQTTPPPVDQKPAEPAAPAPAAALPAGPRKETVDRPPSSPNFGR